MKASDLDCVLSKDCRSQVAPPSVVPSVKPPCSVMIRRVWTAQLDMNQVKPERGLVALQRPRLPAVGGVENQPEVSNRPAGPGVYEVDAADG